MTHENKSENNLQTTMLYQPIIWQFRTTRNESVSAEAATNEWEKAKNARSSEQGGDIKWNGYKPIQSEHREKTVTMTAAAVAMRIRGSSIATIPIESGFIPSIFLVRPSLSIFIAAVELSRLWYRYISRQAHTVERQSSPTLRTRGMHWSYTSEEKVSPEHPWLKGHSYRYHSHTFQPFYIYS